MNFVLDSSLTGAFVLKDEATPATDAVLDSLGEGTKACAPALWRWEVANLLLMAERRKRLTSADRHRHLTQLKTLPVEMDEAAVEEAWNATPLLAQKHKLSNYDAAYLELAIRRGLPLGTLDKELRKAAQQEGIPLLPK